MLKLIISGGASQKNRYGKQKKSFSLSSNSFTVEVPFPAREREKSVPLRILTDLHVKVHGTLTVSRQ